MNRHLKASLVGLTALVTTVVVVNLAVSYRRPIIVKSPAKIRWDTPADIPDRYRLYLDGVLLGEFPPPGGPVGCRCQEVQVPATPGTHRIALRSLRLQPVEMESTATEITVRIAP